MPYNHIPVMPLEVISFLNCTPGKIYADCTLGGAGHSKAIVERILPDGLLIGIDQDSAAIQNAKKILKPYESNVRLFHDNFVHLPEILSRLHITAVDGILLDLGLSLYQIEASGRGFSFMKDEPLDMRMDITSDITAKDLVNTLNEKELTKLFYEFGEEKRARRIVRTIIKKRECMPITTSRQLADIVYEATPDAERRKSKIHPATRVFMALRIAVNKELEMLQRFMENAESLLNQKGRLCVLSFHSLEDRIVKRQLKWWEKGCVCPSDFPKCICDKKKVAQTLSKKVLKPTSNEIQQNPMARSARMRIIEKL